MSAYMVVLVEITEPEGFMKYVNAVSGLIPRYGGEYVVRGPAESACLEGDWPDSLKTVVSRWPSMDAARAFWDSDEYTEIKKLRMGKANARVRIFEGGD